MNPVIKYHRMNNPWLINKEDFEDYRHNNHELTIQFTSNPGSIVLKELNELVKEYGNNICVRFYGYYGKMFDCEILYDLPDVKNLKIDCMEECENFHALYKLENLEKLGIGVDRLSVTDWLEKIKYDNLIELTVGESSCKVDLSELKKYLKLRDLHIVKSCKNLESIAVNKSIQCLRLSSIPKVCDLNFINQMMQLSELSIILGGREHLQFIEGLNLKVLEIIRVRGLSTVVEIGSLKELESLRIEDQIRIDEINLGDQLTKLKELAIVNCKGLHKINGFANLHQLNSVIIYDTKVDFENFVKNGCPQGLDHFGFYTTKKRIDRIILDKIRNMGFENRVAVRNGE